MDLGTATVDQLAQALGHSQAFVRAALDRTDGGWTLRFCDVVVGAQPPSWQETHWEYERLALVAAAIATHDLVTAFGGHGGGRLALGQYRANMPAIQDMLQWRHQPSRAAHDRPQLIWPTVTYELHARERAPDTQHHGFVIGNDCPSFPDERSAIRAFLYGDFSTAGTQPALPSELARVRVVQGEAWFQAVRVTPSHLDLRISGDGMSGTRVEINGSTFRRARPVGRTGRLRIPLPLGLPDDAWLYLIRDGRWLDYRALGARLYSGLDRSTIGIDVVVPDDPVSRVESLIAGGEGPQVEFKRELPGHSETDKRHLLKTVAAFANSSGGTLLFGIDSDEMTPIGVDEASDRGGRDRLGDLIRRIVVPTPDFQVQRVEHEGRTLLLLYIKAGSLKPYGIRLAQDKPIEFYTRRGANTYPAEQGEVRAATLSTFQRS